MLSLLFRRSVFLFLDLISLIFFVPSENAKSCGRFLNSCLLLNLPAHLNKLISVAYWRDTFQKDVISWILELLARPRSTSNNHIIAALSQTFLSLKLSSGVTINTMTWKKFVSAFVFPTQAE